MIEVKHRISPTIITFKSSGLVSKFDESAKSLISGLTSCLVSGSTGFSCSLTPPNGSVDAPNGSELAPKGSGASKGSGSFAGSEALFRFYKIQEFIKIVQIGAARIGESEKIWTKF